MNIQELQHKRTAALQLAQGILDTAEKEKRGLTNEERTQYDARMDEAKVIKGDIERAQTLEAELRAQGQPATRENRPNPVPVIGMSQDEASNYSIVRAIRAADEVSKNPRAWQQIAPLEWEASEAVAERVNMRPRSFFVPPDVLFNRALKRLRDERRGWIYQPVERREMNKTAATEGGNLVATDLLVDSFIEMLRNAMAVQRAGATILGDLVGDIAIPRQTGGATAYWVAESNNVTGSTPTVDQVPMKPKTVGAYTDISRKLLKQSSIDVEGFVRRDLSTTVALAIDLASLHGAGDASNEPTGIAGTTNVGVCYAGGAANNGVNVNGAALTWADIVNLETKLAVNNADIGTLAYMTNAKVRGALKQTARVSGTDSRFIWSDDAAAPLNGYPAWVTNQVKSTLSKGGSNSLSALFHGNWADLIIGMWGMLDVLVDPYTGGKAGTVRTIVLQDVDSVLRHPESFAVILDAVA